MRIVKKTHVFDLLKDALILSSSLFSVGLLLTLQCLLLTRWLGSGGWDDL